MEREEVQLLHQPTSSPTLIDIYDWFLHKLSQKLATKNYDGFDFFFLLNLFKTIPQEEERLLARGRLNGKILLECDVLGIWAEAGSAQFVVHDC